MAKPSHFCLAHYVSVMFRLYLFERGYHDVSPQHDSDIPIVVEAELILPADCPLLHPSTVSIQCDTMTLQCMMALGVSGIQPAFNRARLFTLINPT